MTDVARETRRPAAVVDPQSAQRAPEIEALAALLEQRRNVAAGGLWGASQSLCLAALALRVQGPWLAVVSTEAEARAFAEDLESFGAGAALLCARADAG